MTSYLLLFILCPAYGQWAVTYGGGGKDHVESVEQTPDGYLVAGFTDPIGPRQRADFWILKLHPDGTVAWQRTYGGSKGEFAYPLVLTADGGAIVAGRSFSFGASIDGDGDLWLLKLDVNGNVESQKAYRGSDGKFPRALQQTGDGGYVVAGHLTFSGLATGDVFVLKLGPTGDVEWHKTYGGAGDEYAFSLEQTDDAGYIVAGYATSSGAGKQDIWVVKLHADGTIDWQKTYGGSEDEEGRSVHPTSDGGYVVAGFTRSFGAGLRDLWVLKLDPSGNVVWQKTYGGSGNDWRTRTIRETSDGGYIVAVGETESFGTSTDAWLLKLDDVGGVEWQKTYGGSSYDESESLRPTSDGGYVVCGNTHSFGEFGKDDFFIWKLGADGTMGAACALGQDTNVSGMDSAGVALTSSLGVSDTPVTTLATASTMRETTRLPNFICASEICENGLDDDNDALIDCEDAECASCPACLPELVSDPEGKFFQGPISWNGGTQAWASVTVRNVSASVDSGSFVVATWLSDDAVPGPAAVLKRTDRVQNLGPGDDVVLGLAISDAASMTGKYLISWIDAGTDVPIGNVTESIEKNNFVLEQIP